MTREEASKILRDMLPGPIVPPVHPGSQKQEAIRVALTALRGPTREMVERIAGEWQGTADGYADGELVYDMWSCSECGYTIDTDDPDDLPIVCPHCLAPMTDEAVDMMLERWKEALENA